jgi:hypothetical protein
MATYSILSWKDIPSVVEATDANGTVKVQLSERFQALIDSVAMQLGMAGTDAYLEQWSTAPTRSVQGALARWLTPWPQSWGTDSRRSGIAARGEPEPWS